MKETIKNYLKNGITPTIAYLMYKYKITYQFAKFLLENI